MIVITLSDIIGIGLFIIFGILILLYIIISIIVNKYREKSKKWHDCTKCKYHYFRSTPDWYSCYKKLYDGSHDYNDIVWTKCEKYEENKE